MKTFKTSLLFLLILATALQDVSLANPPQKFLDENEDCSEEKNLKILSWNIYMLPPIVAMTGRRERAHAIVEQLKNSDFDVIVFQEAFHHAVRNIISNGLKEIFPYHYGPANAGGFSIKISSGVWVLSRTPLKVLNTTKFTNCHGIDCWARKGAMLLEGEFNGKKIQLLGTHLQADGFDEIRLKQMDQIYEELLATYKQDGVPQIICGDMNTEEEMTRHYCEMLECLDAQDGDISSIEKCSYDGVNNEIAQSFGAKKKMNYDYILVRNNGLKIKSVKRFVNILKKGKKHLSDHYGVICELKF